MLTTISKKLLQKVDFLRLYIEGYLYSLINVENLVNNRRFKTKN